MKINNKHIDHEELTHIILAQNARPYTEEEILTYVDEYLKEHWYSENENFWIDREYELESIMNDIADILNMPVCFHMIWEPDSDWYMIWKWAFNCWKWNNYIWTILDEDYDFDCVWTQWIVKKMIEVQASYINMADKFASFIEKTLE